MRSLRMIRRIIPASWISSRKSSTAVTVRLIHAAICQKSISGVPAGKGPVADSSAVTITGSSRLEKPFIRPAVWRPIEGIEIKGTTTEKTQTHRTQKQRVGEEGGNK